MNKTRFAPSSRALLAAFAGLVFAAACASPSALADDASVAREASQPAAVAAATLTVRVAGVRVTAGPLMIAVFDSQEGWSGDRPVFAARVDATDAVVEAVFEAAPLGTYGVKLYQDINADGEMNTNMFGIPTEPFGFSNDAPVRFGPPAWDAARFDVSGDVAHTITLPE